MQWANTISLISFYGSRGLKLVRGEGQYVWDSQGRRYLDAHTGHGAAFLGHRPPKVVQALKDQLDSIIVTTPSFSSESRERCISSLGKILPRNLTNVYFQNSGTEAVELALKLAFKATGREEVIAFMNGFHGRTLGSLSATWNPKYRDGYPLLRVKFARFNDVSSADLITDKTAAVIVEPIQGEGGIRPSTRDFLKEMRRACDEHGAALIVDEVQSGFGRTGSIWAHRSRGIEADIMTAGKSIGGGFPVSLVAAKEWIIESLRGGEHGSTHGGNPLACAALYGGIKTLLEEDIPFKSAKQGEKLLKGLREIRSALIREVRGEGLMIGIEIRSNVTPILRNLQDRGILALRAGRTVLRLLPPYLITEDDIDSLLREVEGVLNEEQSRGGFS